MCQLEYSGTAYAGWQAQTQLAVRTVQEELEAALSAVAAAPVRVACAGRTDAGVHATGQVVHFTAPVARSPKSWVLGTNARLAPDIRVKWAGPVNARFHARFSARSRRYHYLVANTAVRPALVLGQVSWYRAALDEAPMDQAAQYLVGEQDFSAFRAAGCQSSTPMRRVDFVRVSRRGDLLLIDIQANAFLHHMVRNIVGSLLVVGRTARPPEWIAELLASGDRTLSADTAPADGLYLVGVQYPAEFGLPQHGGAPLFQALARYG